jgi:O-antigen/teichoic acid export membrane protein
MKRTFFINILYLVAINLLVKPVYLFGIDRTVQNVVGPDSYGGYWALYSFILLFQVLNDLGLQNFTNTYISQNRARINKYFGHLAGLKMVASIVFGILVILTAYLVGYRDLHLLLPLLVSQILVSGIFFFRANLAGLGHYRLDSTLSILDKGLMILICGALLVFDKDHFTIYTFVRLQVVTLLITAFVAAILVSRHTLDFRIKWQWTTLFAFLKKSAPYAFTFILTTLFTRIDSVMLERMLPDGTYQAGVYAAGFRILDAANMIAYLFAGLLLPMFAHVHRDRKATEDLLGTAVSLMSVVVLTLSLVTVRFNKEIMDLLYVGAGEVWYSSMSLLMWSFIPMGLSYIAGALLIARNLLRPLNTIYFFGVLINVALNIYWIPKYGVEGAARATLWTQGVVTVLAYLVIVIAAKVRPGSNYILKVVAFFSVSVALYILSHQIANSIGWEVLALLFITCLGLLALILRMVPWSLIRKTGID